MPCHNHINRNKDSTDWNLRSRRICLHTRIKWTWWITDWCWIRVKSIVIRYIRECCLLNDNCLPQLPTRQLSILLSLRSRIIPSTSPSNWLSCIWILRIISQWIKRINPCTCQSINNRSKFLTISVNTSNYHRQWLINRISYDNACTISIVVIGVNTDWTCYDVVWWYADGL